MIKLKRVPALGTVYLKNTISPACSIHQRPRINISAPRDQFQRIQVIAEQRRWLFATIRHYSPLFVTIRTIRTIRYSLFATIRCSLFAIRDYSLFAIRVFQTPTFHCKMVGFLHSQWLLLPGQALVSGHLITLLESAFLIITIIVVIIIIHASLLRFKIQFIK